MVVVISNNSWAYKIFLRTTNGPSAEVIDVMDSDDLYSIVDCS